MKPFISTHLPFWLALLLGASAIYLPGLDNALVFDDNRLTDGTVFGNYGALSELKQRLLSYGSFVWIAELFGDGWWKQRLVNLLFHVGTAAGLWLLVRTLMGAVRWPESSDGTQPTAASRDAAATVGVLLFALNPVAVYAVAYLIQRSILMAAFFSVWALVLTARAARRHPAWLAAAALAYGLAVLSKEHAVLLPLPALALYLWLRPATRRQLMAVAAIGALMLAAAVHFLASRYAGILGSTFDANSLAFVAELEALKPGIGDEVYPLSVVNQAWLFFKYGLLWALPNVQWMSLDLRPAFPLSMTAFPQVLGLPLYAAVLAGALYLMWRFDDWRRYVGFALFTPAALFGTEFATVWIQDPFVLYRSYLWAIGMPLLFALPFVGARPRTVFGIGVVLCAGLVALSVERVHSLASEFDAWSDAAEKIDREAPANAVGRSRPFLNRGNQHLQREMANLAANDYATAVQLGDRSGLADYHLGSALQVLGRFDQALAAFERAERAGGMQGFANLLPVQKADLLLRMQRFADARTEADKALQGTLDAEQKVHVLKIRAQSSIRLGDGPRAVEDYRALITLEPTARAHRIGHALALNAAGEPFAALQELDRVQAGGDSADLRFARAMVLGGQGRRNEAAAEARRALELKPGDAALSALLKRLEGQPR